MKFVLRILSGALHTPEQQIAMTCTVNIFVHISFNLNQILWFEHSLESSLRDDSNEWSQHRSLLRNKKVSIWNIQNRIENICSMDTVYILSNNIAIIVLNSLNVGQGFKYKAPDFAILHLCRICILKQYRLKIIWHILSCTTLKGLKNTYPTPLNRYGAGPFFPTIMGTSSKFSWSATIVVCWKYIQKHGYNLTLIGQGFYFSQFYIWLSSQTQKVCIFSQM